MLNTNISRLKNISAEDPRHLLLQRLERYESNSTLNAEELASLECIRSFVATEKNCFERENLAGHITGSAMVTTAQFDRVLLTLHRKLKKWLQLGGHSDGDPDTARVAFREAVEESGIAEEFLHLHSHVPFDVDCHDIPAIKDVPAHTHYDVRFVVIASRPESIAISEESEELRWFTLEEAKKVTDDPSTLRQIHKIGLMAPKAHP